MEISSQLEDFSTVAMEETDSSSSLVQEQEVLQITEPSMTIVVPTLKNRVELPDFLYKNRVILSRSKGRSRGRNDGALKCNSEFILFVDDDADFTEETYEKYILKPLRDFPDVVVSMEGVVVSSRAMAVSRNLFFKLGGFDETFDNAEDVDFGYRAAEAGCKIAYIPRDLIIHREHPRQSRERSALRSYVNAIRFLHRYRRIILWDKKTRKAKIVRFSPLNVFRMFTDAPKRGLLIPVRIILSVTLFFYYMFFDKSRLIQK